MDLVGNRNVPKLLEHTVRTYPDKVFLCYEDQAITYAQLDALVNRAANAFLGLGIRKGDHVAVHLPNCPEWLYAVFGLHKIGAVAVTSNTQYKGDELRHLLIDSDSKIIVTEPAFLGMVREIRPLCTLLTAVVLARTDEIPSDVLSFNKLLAAASPDRAAAAIAPDDPATVLYTSGTTARPKGVIYSHGNHVFAGYYTAGLVRLGPDDRIMCFLPLYHLNGMSMQLFPVVAVGAGLALVEEFKASLFSELVYRYKPTVTSVTSQVVKAIVAVPERPEDRESTLRVTFHGLSLDDASWDEFERRFGCVILEEYGQTEALTIPLFNPIDGPQKRRCAGIPGLGYELKIVDEQGNEVAPGTIGELIVRCYTRHGLSHGYYKNPEATAEVFRDGWLYTNDYVRMDEEGYFYFADRKKDMIKRSGENVAASEVERVLGEHPAVAEAVVIGVPDPFRDEAVKALVILRPALAATVEELREHCRRYLADYKVPQFVEFRADFPRNFLGKVEKKTLRQWERERYEAASRQA